MRFLFAEAHQDDVCGQAMEPRGEGGLAAERVNFAEELEEGFLREVFGFEGVAEHAEAETVDAAGVLAIEVFEGGGVTTLSAADGGVELRCGGGVCVGGLEGEFGNWEVVSSCFFGRERFR